MARLALRKLAAPGPTDDSLAAQCAESSLENYVCISSPSRGFLRLMILSKASKFARTFRSAKYFAVCSAETFFAIAVATN